MSEIGKRKAKQKRLAENHAVEERARDTCPECLGGRYLAGLEVGFRGRRWFRRCLDCGFEVEKVSHEAPHSQEKRVLDRVFPGWRPV